MATPDETLTPTAAIVAHLQAAGSLVAIATAGVWRDPAPDKGDAIYVTVDLQSDLVHGCGGGCRWHDTVYAVKAFGPADRIREIERAAVLIDRAMTEDLVDWPGWHVMGRWLESPLEYPDPRATTGLAWEHRGGLYRLHIEETCPS